MRFELIVTFVLSGVKMRNVCHAIGIFSPFFVCVCFCIMRAHSNRYTLLALRSKCRQTTTSREYGNCGIATRKKQKHKKEKNINQFFQRTKLPISPVHSSTPHKRTRTPRECSFLYKLFHFNFVKNLCTYIFHGVDTPTPPTQFRFCLSSFSLLSRAHTYSVSFRFRKSPIIH